MAFNRNLLTQDCLRSCRHPQPSHPPRNCTQPLLVSAAIAGLPRDHDVPIRICHALRPQKHPCPPAPAGDHDPMPTQRHCSHLLALVSRLLSLSCLGLMLA